MIFRDTTILLDRVDSSQTRYRISMGGCPDSLVRSIQSLGLLHPPFLVKENEKWVIVSGFKRVEACRRLGFDRISVREIPGEASCLDRVRTAIADNLLARPLNCVEMGNAFALLAPCCQSDKELATEAAALGLPAGKKAAAEHLALNGLSKDILHLAARERISLPVALELGRLDDAGARAFVRLFSQVKMSLNKQREVVLHATEIAKREEVSVAHVLNAPTLTCVLDQPEPDPNAKSRQIRAYLHARRFPETHRAFEKMNRIFSALPLAPGMRLDPPFNYETNQFSLTLFFQNPAQLKEHGEKVAEMASCPELPRLWDGPGKPGQ